MSLPRRSRRRRCRPGFKSIDSLFCELLESKRLLAADLAVGFSDLVLDTTESINVAIDGKFEDTAVSGTVIKFETNAPLADNNFYVELTDNTPLTNSNFLSYVNSGAYDNSLFHRSVSNSVIQGGSYSAPTVASDQPGGAPVKIPTTGAIQNEPGNLNNRGTISMAKLGGQPDSATSQFFFNLENNSFLDSDNGGYTVFGEVLGSGMTVVDTMAAADTYVATTYYSDTALSDLPLWNVNEDTIVRPNDFVKIENVGVVTESDLFTYTVSSSDPARLIVTVDSNGDLVLNQVGVEDGTVDVTVTATSKLDDSTATDQFSVQLQPVSPWGYPLKEQPQGNWLHSSGEGPSQSSSWYPTAIPSHESLTQHGYATYWHHTGTPAGWFTQPTFSTNKFFVFETYVTSETTQSIDYLLGGNDGHSLFVNDQFVKGAGFGNDNVSGSLTFQAGVPVKVTLVGYNSGADTHISFRTADLQNIEDLPGVSISAKLFHITSSEHAFELDDSKPTITGFGTPGASIEVFADLNRDGTTETSIGTTTVGSDNSWSLNSAAWLPGGPVNVSATQDTGDPELLTADGVITVRTNRPGALVEVGADLLADGYINAAEASSNIVLRTPFDGSMISAGNSLWVFTDTGGNKTFALQTVGSTAQANNYKEVGFSADLLREGPQAIDAWFTPASSGGEAREVLSVIKDTIAPEATLGVSDASIFSNETATVSITLSEDVNGLDVTDFVVSGGTLTNLAGDSLNLTATFTPDVDFSGTATISIASGAFTDVAGNPNTASSSIGTTILPEIFTTSGLSRFEDEGVGGEFGVWTDAIAFAENRIASYVPTGSGFVRTWSLSESNEITRSGDISSPHTVHSDGFGFSLILDETILGIGSPKTWVNSPHDGRFYLYDPATRASIATLNPQPHTAQYFGASSAISENNYFVVSETGNWDHDTSFGITFYGYDDSGQPTLLFQETIDPDGSPVAQYGGNLAVSGEYVVGGYHLETEKTFSLKVWQVNGSGAEATVSGWAPVEIETIDDFYNGRGEQRLATNGNLIVRSSSLSNVVNVFQIDPVGKTINHVTDIETPPGVSGFGEAVTFTDNKLFIGAPSATGESYLFIYDVNDSGIQRNSFVSSSSLGASAGSEFGSHIVFDDGKVLIAAGADAIYLGDAAALDGINDLPEIDAIADISINEDAPEQIVSLTGINAGGGEAQPLRVTANSSDTGLIPDPTVDFDGQSSTGTLKFTPVADQSGTATITVTVEDGGLDNDLGTPDDNGLILRTVIVRAEAVNDEPTLDELSDVNINEDDPEQTVNLNGITAGGGETQVLSITATSDNTGLIPDPTVDFDGQSSTGILKFTPVADQSGTATITVTVTDGGLDNDLSTPEDNGSILRTVVVKADPVNDAPVLDPAASLQLASVLEDAAAPVGQVGSLVSNLIDAGGIHNNFSDVDGDSPGIAITGVNLQGGSLWFSNDDGATWVDVGAVSNAVPKLLAADATTRLYFQPAANFNGTIGDVITLRAWDRTGHWDESSTSLLGESAGDGFGHSVALSGDGLTAIVGGLSNDGSGSNAGHVQVYRRADETAAWFQLGPDFEGENPEDAEGFSVAISANGNTVAFGTPRSDDAFLNAGQVRIFRWDGIQWSQLGTDINGMGTDECSGWAIDLNEHGDIIAIGGVSDPAGTVRGQTRVYKYVDSEWTQVGSDIPGEAVGDWSGHSVRLSGDGEIVAIGASHNGPDTGHVRVFSWNGSVWLQQGSDIDGEHAGDQFGHSVAMSQDGRFVAIGSPHNSDGGSLAGHVRVLQWNAVDNAWQQVGADLDGESAGDRYGAAVAISDDGKLLAIGAHGAHNFTGHVSVYQWTGSEWNNLPHGSVHGLSDREFFGLSVDLSSNGHTMIVGAPSTPLAVASTSSNSGYSKIISLAPALNALSDSADTVSVTVVPENDEPTLDVLSDTNINEDDPEQTVNLTGITAGGGETQVLSVTATSDNTGLIPDPTVTFDGQSSTGTLKFTPVADQFGTATITVTVEDGGLDDDLGTPDDNGSILRTVVVKVEAVNDEPTLDELSDVNINEDDPEQTVNLTGITAGGGETQVLSIAAVSDNTGLIPDPTVDFDGQSSTGTLKFTPVADQSGTATITVTVTDGGLDNDLGTPDDNGSILRTVVVKAEAVNDEPTLDALSDVNINEDDLEQTVNLTGITAGGGETQVLSITAVSDNTGLIPDPTVDFDGQSSTATLNFTPVADQFGTATITVTVEDGGLDNDLGTPDDNGVINRTVTVITEAVNDEPTLNIVADLVLPEDSLTQVLDITGITAGGDETQPLQVTASSSDPSLVLHPTVTSRPALGADVSLLTVTPLPGQYGIATITVTVEDGGLDLDLNTAEDNATFGQTFDVTITPDTDNPPSPVTPHGKMFIHETLSGDSLVSYQLPAVNVNGEAINGLFNRITATSSDAALIPDPTVIYASADVPSSLSFSPVADVNGSAILSIQVEDGGPDNDFATIEDNRQATHQVEVNVLEVISNQGSATLAKDGSENLYANTQPVTYQEQQAQTNIAGFAAIGATSEDGENALLVQRSSVTNRLVTDDAWRINGLFDALQNESSTVLDLTAREVSSTLNIAAVSGAYEVNGVNNPTLIVRHGQTYTLNLNVAGHPFYLQTTGSGYQSANTYSGGFTGNGQTSGEHQWVVPEDAPDEIYYQCEFHPVMFGKIIVID